MRGSDVTIDPVIGKLDETFNALGGVGYWHGCARKIAAGMPPGGVVFAREQDELVCLFRLPGGGWQQPAGSAPAIIDSGISTPETQVL